MRIETILDEDDDVVNACDVALIREQDRGFCQGGKASGPLSHLVMVRIIEKMKPLLLAAHDNLQCAGPPPNLYAYADNMYGAMHYKIAPLFFQLMTNVGREHFQTFTDKHIFLQGSSLTRNLVQKRVARLDPTLAQLIRRPDLKAGDAGCDIPLPAQPPLPGTPPPRVFTLEPESLGAAGLQEVMGVPIAAVLECDTEREAFEVVVEQKVLAFVEGADKLCVLCDAALAESTMQSGNFMSPSCLAFEALVSQRRGID